MDRVRDIFAYVKGLKFTLPLPKFAAKKFAVVLPLPKFSIKQMPFPVSVNYLKAAGLGLLVGVVIYFAAQAGYKPTLPDLTKDVRVVTQNLNVRECAPTEGVTCAVVRGLVVGDEVSVSSDDGEWCVIGQREVVACRFLAPIE
jgi:hypothetical protein